MLLRRQASDASLLLSAVAILFLTAAWLSDARAVEVVGTTPGTFAVNQVGAATYTIPINAPAASGGVRPNLSLVYNQRGGMGIAGQGWNIGGLSAITRCPRTVAQDGETRGVQYDSDDRFCLDGQRLVLISGTYGAANSEYRTEVDSFRKIIAYGTQGNGPQYFTVWDRDGTRYWYGHWSNSSLVESTTNSYRNWRVRKVRDNFSNDINPFYWKNDTTGEQFLDFAQYAYNGAQSLPYKYRVEFTYETRPTTDQRSGYVWGAPWAVTQRLSKIETKYDGVVIHDYTLSYSTGTTGRSQLDSVQQCGPTDCLPETTFDWQDGDSSWNASGSAGPADTGKENALVGDFNNDGQQDLFVPQSGTWKVHTASGGAFTSTISLGPADNPSYAHVFDYNGDNKSDLLVPDDDGYWHVYQSTGTGYTNLTTTLGTTGYATSYVTDVNGDGFIDLLYQDANKLYWAKNNGGSFASPTEVAVGNITPNSAFGVTGRGPDFDGDGQGDLIALEVVIVSFPDEIYYYQKAFRFDGSDYVELTNLGEVTNPIVIDINGDGLDDVAYKGYDGDWWTQISTGSGFATAVSTGISATETDVRVADYDGDGREDLLRPTSTVWYAHTSDGNTLATTGINAGGTSATTNNARVMDVTGDGYQDLAITESGTWRVRSHKSAYADVVTEFSDGLGNTHQPSYAPLSTMDDYSGSATATFPTQRLRGPWYVVDSYSANNGRGGNYSQDYQYQDAMVHVQGYGFLGFAVLKIIDSRNNDYRQLHFTQQIPYRGMLNDAYHKQSDNTVIRREDPELSHTAYGSLPNRRYFLRVKKQTTTTFEIAGALKGQEIRKIVDDPTFETTYGNVTKRVITTTSARAPGKSYTTTLDYLYANHTTPWCLGLPTQVKVTRAASGATTKIRTTNNTFNSSNCRLLTSTNASQSSTALQLKTTLTYDSYGNLKTATQDSADGAAADRKTEFFYDSNGHLPTSQKWYIDSLTNPEVSKTWDYELIQPLSTTDTQGQTTSWTYDDFARVKSETRPDGTSSTWAYTACIDCWHTGRGRFYVQRDDSDGLAVRDHRDWYGRSIGGWNHLPTGTKSQNKTNYDALGRIVRRYLPWVAGESNYYATYSYDLIGRMTQENRPISETLSSGAITSYTYQGLTQTVTNPESQVTTTKLDPLGRIIKVTDDDNGETEYQYTVFDALYKTWDPADNLTTINYNNRGDKTSMSEPNMGSWSYAYNVFGELTSQTDAKSQNITFSYNQLGLRTNRVDPEGTTSWGYYTTSDAKLWLPSSADSPGFEEDYSYDTLSRPSSTTTTIDSVAYTTNYSYHSSGSGKGKLNRITYPTSTPSYRLKIDHVYDAWGHLNQVKNSSGTVYYELDETDALGRERESTLGNDLVEKRVYDAANLTLTSVETGPGTTATIQDLYYEWDKLGNLTRREDLDQSVYETFTYDDLNRLKSASRNGTSTLTVSYNNLGNISSKSDVGSYTYGAGSAGPHAVTSITGTRPGTYSYDANGNLSSRAGDSITWYSYNKPKKINDGSDYAEFKYGPDRARFKQVNKDGSTTTTTYYVGPHFEKETVGSTTQYRHNIFAGGQMVAIYTRPTSGSTTQYVHRDHQSSVVALTDTAGAIDQEFSFDAFGARRNTDWSADFTEFDSAHDTERGYTGHEHIDNARLIHMNGRVQDPITGRMISADPFVPNPFNTQAFNRYSYVYNSPLSLVDPSGFDPCSGSAFECASAPAQDPRKYPGSSVTDADGRAARQLWNQVANWGNRDPAAAPIVSQVLGYTDSPTPSTPSTDSPTEASPDGDNPSDDRNGGQFHPGIAAGQGTAKFVGVQAAIAGDVRAAQTAVVGMLNPHDTLGRSNVKALARSRTPRLIGDLVERVRPDTGPRSGSVGRANVSSRLANIGGRILRHGGRALVGVSLLVDAARIYSSDQRMRTVFQAGFGTIGAFGGGALGVLGGSAVAPGLGTVGFGIAGAAAGGAGGEFVGGAIYDLFFRREEDY